jgi:type VI secretion system protein ImpL
MFAFLKRTVAIVLGFLLIVVFVWYAGPYFAFGPYRPLETSNARLIAIGVIVGWWLLVRLVKRLRAFRASDRLLAAVVAQPQPEPARTPAEVAKLRERFDEAVSALKQQRRSGHSLYELPWYVIIGAPGSGKTTALLNSGLKFPLEQRVGKGALRGVGGTRNCDWWFTDEAIFLDTAGRYTTQDSDATSDSVGWREFLALLRKYRERRPVNGVILTINAQDLIVQGTAAREAHVEAARSRLEELNRELRIQLPVYLMVTKCDLVDGFAEYFEDLTADGRAQVWGVTFPYEQTLANESPQVFPAEFDALMTRLNERVFERVEAVRDTRRRTKVFAFPQQMATVREALTQFVTEVFDSRHFDGQILLRGVYFTSGTQHGTPIDRLLGSIARTFGATAAVMAPSGPGKAYFVETLLKDVMIGESGLAGINRGLEARKAAAQLGAYAAMGLVAAAGVAVLTISYSRNREFLEQTQVEIAALAQVPPVAPTSPVEPIVSRLNAIRAVVESADRYRASTTWAMSWGLYQGASIGNSARDAYVRELDSILLPRVAEQIRARVSRYASEPLQLWAYLKGYLMLGNPKRLDKDHLTSLEWEGAPAGSSVGPSLSTHFQSLLESGEALRPLPLDGTVVAQALNSIRQTSMAKIVYESVKRASLEDKTQDLRIDQHAGLGVETVFKRRSGQPLSAPMPGLYTRNVFKQITGTGRSTLLAVLSKDAWVWGENGGTALLNSGAVVTEVTNLYETDYTNAWNAFLDDLQLVSFRSVSQINEALRTLVSSTSPLRGILRVTADNTTLAEIPTGPASKGVINQTTKTITEKLDRVLAPIQRSAGRPSTEPGTMVTARFQWVRQLTSGEAGKTQLDEVLRTLAEVQKQLDTLGPDVAGIRSVEIQLNPTFRGLGQTLRDQADVLPASVRTLVSQIADALTIGVTSDATHEIEQLYEQQVLPTCRALIANRYPFASAAQTDVQLDDFGKVFGYDGLFDKFFKDNLEKQVDTARSPWTWRPGAVSPRRRLLEQFQAAHSLRDMFFPPGSKTPDLKFAVTITDLDRAATRFVLEIDGRYFDDKHQPPVKKPAGWPGPTPGRAAGSFESRYYDPPKTYGGPWAWFRMIDSTADGPADPQQRIRLNVRTQYHRVHVTVEAARAGDNPFATQAWRQFSCES